MSRGRKSDRGHVTDTSESPYSSGPIADRKAFFLACLEFDVVPGSRTNAWRREEAE